MLETRDPTAGVGPGPSPDSMSFVQRGTDARRTRLLPDRSMRVQARDVCWTADIRVGPVGRSRQTDPRVVYQEPSPLPSAASRSTSNGGGTPSDSSSVVMVQWGSGL